MGHLRYSTAEIVARGKEIYDNQLREKLEPHNIGKFLVIDVETGEYEMDEDDLAASRRASLKKPDGVRFGMRIGSLTSGTLGNALTGAALKVMGKFSPLSLRDSQGLNCSTLAGD